jgi:CBS domain-containing protein
VIARTPGAPGAFHRPLISWGDLRDEAGVRTTDLSISGLVAASKPYQDRRVEIGPLVTQQVLSVGPDHSLLDTARMMSERKVGAAIVQTDEGHPAIITERDVLRAVSEGANLSLTTVSVYMTSTPVCASCEWDVVEAAKIMRRGGFRHLIVLNDGSVVGMLSIRDLVDALVEEHERLLLA